MTDPVHEAAEHAAGAHLDDWDVSCTVHVQAPHRQAAMITAWEQIAADPDTGEWTCR